MVNSFINNSLRNTAHEKKYDLHVFELKFLFLFLPPVSHNHPTSLSYNVLINPIGPTDVTHTFLDLFLSFIQLSEPIGPSLSL